MKKLLFSLLALACCVAARAQLLYEISGNGLRQSSYVIGTYHLAPVSFVDSIPGLHDALNRSQQVYGELDMKELMSQDVALKLQRAMMLQGDTTLMTLLTAEQQARLNAGLRQLVGVDLTNPLIAGQLGKLTPSALLTQLSVLLYMKKRNGFDPMHPFDNYFQEVATRQGKPVGGFESVDFQINTLFKGQSMERQVQLLLCFADNLDFQEALADEIIGAFFSQSLEGMEQAEDAKLSAECDSRPEEEDMIIYNRNATWAQAMPAIMAERATFFAVGAAHLPGDRGLLALLRKAGYSVTPVNAAPVPTPKSETG